MTEANAVNYVDLIVLGIMVISLGVGFMRGFTQETLGIVGWLGASFTAIYMLPVVRPLSRKVISSPLIADMIGGAALFLITLIVLTLICRAISSRVKESGLGSVDRSLGLVFGGARGFLLLSLVYLMATSLTKIETWPEQARKAKVMPLLARGSSFINSLLPSDFKPKNTDKLLEDLRSSEEIMRSLSRLNPVQEKKEKELEYTEGQKKKIKELFNK